MKPIERVMQTYGLMVNLSPEQEQTVRERLKKFLAKQTGTDQELTVQGLQFLRGTPRAKRPLADLKHSDPG